MGVKLGSVVALLVALAGQQAPPRDAPAPGAPPPAGTGRITGLVVAADNGMPVKRATVLIVGYGGLPPARPPAPAGTLSATASSSLVITSGIQTGVVGPGGPNQPGWRTPKTTDDAGRFEFTDLPAGQFSFSVTPQSGFVPLRVPQRVVLKDGGTAAITLKLERTGAITGRILDESGDPMPRARVTALRQERGATRPRPFGSGAMTDDTGQYRLFDLPPGEYTVAATLQQPSFANQPAGEPGFTSTYYPGTAVAADAQRVIVKSAQDTPGVDFGLVRVPMGSVTGVVRDAAGQILAYDPRSGAPGMSANVMIASEQDGLGYSRGSGVRPDGTFQIGALAPGTYQLVASLTRGQGPGAAREGAVVPITVNGDEQRVDLQLNRGATISGRVVVEGSRPLYPPGITPPPGNGIARVSLRPAPGASMYNSLTQAPQIGDDGAFEITGARGAVMLQVFAMGTAVVKSITHGGDDLLTAPLELSGTERIRDVIVTLTTDTGRIEGTATKNGTDPALDAAVIVFPDDAGKWFPGSPFVSVTRSFGEMAAGLPPPPPGMPSRTPGSFVSRNLLPGRYYVVALDTDALAGIPGFDRESLEHLRVGATSVTVTAGPTSTVTVKVRKPDL